jgi:hypothetical protein
MHAAIVWTLFLFPYRGGMVTVDFLDQVACEKALATAVQTGGAMYPMRGFCIERAAP